MMKSPFDLCCSYSNKVLKIAYICFFISLLYTMPVYAKAHKTKVKHRKSTIAEQTKARNFIWKLWENDELSIAHEEGLKYIKKYSKSTSKKEIIYLLARIEYKQGKVKQAIRRVLYLLKYHQFRYRIEAGYDAAFWLYKTKKLKQAKQILYKNLEQKQTKQWQAKNSFLLGTILEKQKQYKAAIISYQVVLDQSDIKDKIFLETLTKQAKILILLEEFKEAEKIFALALQQPMAMEKKVEIYILLGDAYAKKQQWDRSLYWYEKTKQEKEGQTYAKEGVLHWFGLIYDQYRKKPKTIVNKEKFFTKAILKGQEWITILADNKREQADFYYYIGWFLYWQNKLPQAQEALHTAQRYSIVYRDIKQVTLLRINILTKQKKYIFVSQLLARLNKQAKTVAEKNEVILRQVRNFYFLKDCKAILNIRSRVTRKNRTVRGNIDSYYNRCRVK